MMRYYENPETGLKAVVESSEEGYTWYVYDTSGAFNKCSGVFEEVEDPAPFLEHEGYRLMEDSEK